jgi:Ca2+-binding EF-hand superfamily protein
MARGKKAFKVINKFDGDIDQKELNEIFQQLSGDPTKLDPEIIKDKYERLKNAILRCNKLIIKFKEAILDKLVTKRGKDASFDYNVNALVSWVERANEFVNEDVEPDHLVHFYQNMKESFVVEEYLKICKVLTQNETYLKDRCNLSDAFIRSAVGEDFFIFDFAKINFKHLFSFILKENFSDPEEYADAKKYILITLNMLYITTQDIYKLISSPDVDIDHLSEVIVKAVDAARKQIPRCDKAFRIISNSVDMLKSNMNTYYKDFVATSNPTIIFESFIQDITTSINMDTQTLMQFKRIIFFFKKKSESMPKNPQLNSMFGTLDKIMNIVEGKSNKGEEEVDENESDSDSSDGFEADEKTPLVK